MGSQHGAFDGFDLLAELVGGEDGNLDAAVGLLFDLVGEHRADVLVVVIGRAGMAQLQLVGFGGRCGAGGS